LCGDGLVNGNGHEYEKLNNSLGMWEKERGKAKIKMDG
jgi:hypothetical protein